MMTSADPTRLLVASLTDKSLQCRLLAGSVEPGDTLADASSGHTATVLSVQSENSGGLLEISVDDARLLPAGTLLSSHQQRPEFADQFTATIHWNSSQALLPGRNFTLQLAGQERQASISKLKYLESTGGQQLAVSTLKQGQTGVANLALSQALQFDPIEVCEVTARFDLLDNSGNKLGHGEILHGLRRASNIHWQALDVDKNRRAEIKRQTPRVIWLTGLSGSGKSTVANLLEKRLVSMGRHPYLLDGDNVRHGLNKDLGFTEADRVENIRRVAETAKLMVDAGLIVITSFISPFRAERDLARALLNEGEFIEVFVDASLEVCEQRDPKGLYKKARAGDLKNFTGLDSPYEKPEQPEVHLHTDHGQPEEAVQSVLDYLQSLPE